jgi:hypothetical protein
MRSHSCWRAKQLRRFGVVSVLIRASWRGVVARDRGTMRLFLRHRAETRCEKRGLASTESGPGRCPSRVSQSGIRLSSGKAPHHSAWRHSRNALPEDAGPRSFASQPHNTPTIDPFWVPCALEASHSPSHPLAGEISRSYPHLTAQISKPRPSKPNHERCEKMREATSFTSNTWLGWVCRLADMKRE